MKKALLLSSLLFIVIASQAQKKKSKGKSDKDKTASGTDYQQPDAVADTATKFTGVIKYLITSDDPAQKDSMIIVFGDDKIKVTMFYPGFQEKDIFQDIFIANFKDSTFLVLDNRKKTYKTEKLGARNAETDISLMNKRKTAPVLKFICKEFSGEMTMKENDVYEAAALVSSQHSFINVEDYNFMNIQSVVLDYKIVLGWRTKSSDRENTYIMAYEIIPGDTTPYFDITGYKAL